MLTPPQVLLKLPALRPRLSSPPLLTARMRVLPQPRAPASTLLPAQPPRLLPPSDADCNAAVVSTRADVSAALAATAFDANLAVSAASAIAARAVLRRSRPSVGDVCDSAARAFTSIARDRMPSLRDSLLEINAGVSRAAFAPRRLATTRRGEAALPPNVLVLPLSKGCTVRSRSLPQHFE